MEALLSRLGTVPYAELFTSPRRFLRQASAHGFLRKRLIILEVGGGRPQPPRGRLWLGSFLARCDNGVVERGLQLADAFDSAALGSENFIGERLTLSCFGSSAAIPSPSATRPSRRRKSCCPWVLGIALGVSAAFGAAAPGFAAAGLVPAAGVASRACRLRAWLLQRQLSP